jgi:Putative papain-like cysteine peptidase (DUF1796)
METIGISLGWNCHSAQYGVKSGIRKRKSDGYATCPFDEMVSNYPGVVECIDDGLDALYDTQFLSVKKMPPSRWLNNENIVYHSKYKFLFNHESPGHADLYNKQEWSGGMNHFVSNNFEKFVERYHRRVQSLKTYLTCGKHVIFILTRYNTTIDDVSDLHTVISKRYPKLVYDIKIQDYPKAIMCEHMSLMGLNAECEEVKRLL